MGVQCDRPSLGGWGVYSGCYCCLGMEVVVEGVEGVGGAEDVAYVVEAVGAGSAESVGGAEDVADVGDGEDVGGVVRVHVVGVVDVVGVGHVGMIAFWVVVSVAFRHHHLRNPHPLLCS